MARKYSAMTLTLAGLGVAVAAPSVATACWLTGCCGGSQQTTFFAPQPVVAAPVSACNPCNTCATPTTTFMPTTSFMPTTAVQQTAFMPTTTVMPTTAVVPVTTLRPTLFGFRQRATTSFVPVPTANIAATTFAPVQPAQQTAFMPTYTSFRPVVPATFATPVTSFMPTQPTTTFLGSSSNCNTCSTPTATPTETVTFLGSTFSNSSFSSGGSTTGSNCSNCEATSSTAVPTTSAFSSGGSTSTFSGSNAGTQSVISNGTQENSSKLTPATPAQEALKPIPDPDKVPADKSSTTSPTSPSRVLNPENPTALWTVPNSSGSNSTVPYSPLATVAQRPTVQSPAANMITPAQYNKPVTGAGTTTQPQGSSAVAAPRFTQLQNDGWGG
ncbi:MAG: hypothetical protein SFX18_01360 [Pirellulales bacterium]|nr:hypothetical protein [Pirellulales bacterium]